MARKLVTAAASKKQTSSSHRIAPDAVQGRKTHAQVYSEGFDAGIRSSAEAILKQDYPREHVAEAFILHNIPFPFTVVPEWQGWAFEDWDEWAWAE
jgi:hypothetical protein